MTIANIVNTGGAVRILPPKKGSKLFHAACIHRLVNSNHFCHRTLVDGKWTGFCDYCSLYNALWQQGRSQDARQIKPMERYYYNVIARPQQSQGPLILPMGKQLHTIVVMNIVGHVPLPGSKEKAIKKLGDISHYLKGRDFVIVRNQNHAMNGIMYPTYDDSYFDTPSIAGTEEEWASWMTGLHDLASMVKLEDKATVQKVISSHTGLNLSPTEKPKKKSRYRCIDEEWDA